MNSRFNISISHDYVGIEERTEEGVQRFWLVYNNYMCKFLCGSIFGNPFDENDKVTSFVRGREDEIFRKICIKIDDCPEWMRQELLDNRLSYLGSIGKLNQFAENTEIDIKKRLKKR